jgi:DNA helicase-2/ATP-dependent DNA helicase PcrA
VVTIDEAVLSDPAEAVAALHRLWATRQRVVVALDVVPARFSAPEMWSGSPWEYGPDLEAWCDRLHFLVWANTYDARGEGQPIWWWGRKAARAGATETLGGPADVFLPDGRSAWIDGGPRGPLAAPPGTVVVHSESVESGSLRVVPAPIRPTADLAPDQLAAVGHGSGPARVIAPAGSGKTRVLTERLRHLQVDRGFERESVVAVAYNKKAQEELEGRCRDFRPRAQTLNALGYSLLAQHRGRAPRLLAELDVRRLVDGLAPPRQRRVNTDPTAPYLEGLSSIRLGLREPTEVEDSRDDVPGLAAMFDRYRERLAAADAIDFDEQVYGAVEALLRDGPFRRRMQADHRHLLVDEFQDLTPAHVLMIRLLATPRLDVFGVGDDDQVIYGHAGADPSFLIDFASYFPGTADYRLEVNYRCPSVVVDGVRTLLSYNHRRVDKEIRAGPFADSDAGALAVRAHSAPAGATKVSEVVSSWLADDDVLPTEVAVLTRVNSLLLAPHIALVEAGIRVNSVLRPEVLERTGVRAALAYIRIGADPDHMRHADLTEVYRRPSRGFPQWITKWLRDGQSLDDLSAIADKLDDAKVADKIADFVNDLRTVAAAVRSKTTLEVLAVIRDQIGLGKAMGLLDNSGAGEGGASHLDDLAALSQVSGLRPDPATFEAWLRSAFHREADPEGVTLSTIHRVKGREWDRVVIFGVMSGIVPHRLAEDVEEERRVLHVAITRGRHRVSLLTEQGRESIFLAELVGSAPRQPARPRVTSEAAPKKLSRTATVEARVGLTVTANGGFEGTVESLESEGVRLKLVGGGSLVVRYGETVTMRGKAALLVPRPELEPDVERAEEALRAWRLERCRRDKVSAFIVLYDRHLRAIATTRPKTLAELRKVDGIGPTKLELYGEEILDVLASLAQ